MSGTIDGYSTLVRTNLRRVLHGLCAFGWAEPLLQGITSIESRVDKTPSHCIDTDVEVFCKRGD